MTVILNDLRAESNFTEVSCRVDRSQTEVFKGLV